MIIGNNNSANNFNKQNNYKKNNNEQVNSLTRNSFENRWNKIQEYNREHQKNSNGFVKKIEDQKYASSIDTQGMQDRTLAILHDRLEKGTLSLEEFNKKCSQLGQQRQNITKNNKIF